jgi:hypothetical protein
MWWWCSFIYLAAIVGIRGRTVSTTELGHISSWQNSIYPLYQVAR